AVGEVGADGVLYGSFVAGRCFASQLANVPGALLEEPVKQAILGQNLKRLLTPMLQRKGVRI
ncbi:MAG: amidohydrolase, partial [Planctomyces sp.]